MKQLTSKVVSNKRCMSYQGTTYYLLKIHAPYIVSECRPGQFLMLKCGKETVLRRPISIHSISGTDYLEMLYAVPEMPDQANDDDQLTRKPQINVSAGTGTRWLSQLTGGSDLEVIGPMGNGFSIEPTSKHLLLVAGGIGVAPLKYLADYASARKRRVTLLLGARTASAILPDEMRPNVNELLVATEDGSIGERGQILDLIPRYIKRIDQVFACGPIGMYEALADQMNNWIAEKPTQVSLEVRMGCGAGICYSCSIRTRLGMKRVCKEGPVFNIKDIIWQEVKI